MFHKTENDLVLTCSCGGNAISKYALPTADKHIAIFAVCEKCHVSNISPTTVYRMKLDADAWSSFVKSSPVIVRS